MGVGSTALTVALVAIPHLGVEPYVATKMIVMSLPRVLVLDFLLLPAACGRGTTDLARMRACSALDSLGGGGRARGQHPLRENGRFWP